VTGGAGRAPRAGPASPALLRDVRRAVRSHRRLLAAVCTATAVATGLSVLAPSPPASTTVLAAARDLTAGRALELDDLRALELPPSAVPAGALRPGASILGRVVAGPVRRGEPLTDVRLVGAALLAALPAPGQVALPVRIADPAAVGLLRAGDRVDVLAAAEGQATAVVVAADALVVTVPDGDQGADPLAGGALVVLATSPDTARRIAQAAVTARLSVMMRS
jgi:pilus assembly protein CpaB